MTKNDSVFLLTQRYFFYLIMNKHIYATCDTFIGDLVYRLMIPNV